MKGHAALYGPVAIWIWPVWDPLKSEGNETWLSVKTCHWLRSEVSQPAEKLWKPTGMHPEYTALHAKWHMDSQYTCCGCSYVITANWNCRKHVVFLFTGASTANTHLHEINMWMGEENGWALKLNSLASPAGAFVPQLSRNLRLLFIMHSLLMLPVSIWSDAEHLTTRDGRAKKKMTVHSSYML